MKKASHTALLALLTGTLAAGCAGLLGLDDKTFEGEGGTGGAPTGGTGGTAGTGGISGGPAGGMGGDLGGTGGAGGGLGGTGGQCTLSEAEKARVQDDFEIDGCGDAVTVLEDRGWKFSRDVEDYPPAAPEGKTTIEFGNLKVRLDKTMYWYNGTKGYFMYKEIDGDFLVVTDVKTTNAADRGIPKDDQAGAGILVRHPDSAGTATNGQLWLAVDLGTNKVPGPEYPPAFHISWCQPGMPDHCESEPVVKGVPLEGLVAICRINGEYEIYHKLGDVWSPKTGFTPAGWDNADLAGPVQVGLFAYASNLMDTSPFGVIGTFPSVHQIDPVKGCDPSLYE